MAIKIQAFDTTTKRQLLIDNAAASSIQPYRGTVAGPITLTGGTSEIVTLAPAFAPRTAENTGTYQVGVNLSATAENFPDANAGGRVILELYQDATTIVCALRETNVFDGEQFFISLSDLAEIAVGETLRVGLKSDENMTLNNVQLSVYAILTYRP